MDSTYKKNITDYEFYIFDVDGTLYYKHFMRFFVLFKMLFHYIIHLKNYKEAFLLRDYRILREDENIICRKDFESYIRNHLADKYGYSLEKVSSILNDWMIRNPLYAIQKSADCKILTFIAEQKAKGKSVFIYSDYPTEDKCRALGVYPDADYYPDNKNIFYLKPNPQGLLYIMEKHKICPDQVLFIGDRKEKDGLCAEGAGIDYLILEQRILQRKLQYRCWRKRDGRIYC